MKYDELPIFMNPTEAKIQRVFTMLEKSPFRMGFKLKAKEIEQVENKPMSLIMLEGEQFIRARLAPFRPKNDGSQTPMKGHPVFIAQHATATCCRGCLYQWHQITDQRALTEAEIHYVLSVIERWISMKILEVGIAYNPVQKTLF